MLLTTIQRMKRSQEKYMRRSKNLKQEVEALRKENSAQESAVQVSVGLYRQTNPLTTSRSRLDM